MAAQGERQLPRIHAMRAEIAQAHQNLVATRGIHGIAPRLQGNDAHVLRIARAHGHKPRREALGGGNCLSALVACRRPIGVNNGLGRGGGAAKERAGEGQCGRQVGGSVRGGYSAEAMAARIRRRSPVSGANSRGAAPARCLQ